MAVNHETDDAEELISTARLLRLTSDEPEPEVGADGLHLAPAAAPVPKVTRMPEGIEVVERDLGHAVARWVLQVRCECGRRWFEVEPIETADCPRCGALVLVEIEPT